MGRADLIGGRVLVTGATGGLGGAIARAFAARGASLVLSGRRSDVLEPLAAETGARAVAADLSLPEDVERLAREAGDVDVLVANAALPGSGDLGDFSVADIDRALDVNLRAPIVLARLLAEGMRVRRRGHLVFLSSLSGKAAAGGASVYSATKFGLRGFAIALREDLRPEGIGVSTVFPAFVGDAGMYADAGVELPGYVKLVTSAEVAGAVLKAIERNRGEVDVAPLPLKLSGALASVAPGLTIAVGRRLGAGAIAEKMAEGQRGKR
jgi:uncharacterized protein